MIGVVGDPHLGKKSSDSIKESLLFQSQNKFYDFLYEKCIENNIKDIIWTGDTFDTTLSIKSNILQYGIDLFSKKFKDFNHYVILGNHCLFNRDSTEISSIACLENLQNVTVFRRPGKAQIGNYSILFVPYLTSEFSEKFIKNLPKLGKNNDVIVGHFDIIGATMESGYVATTGIPMDTFLKNVKLTLSGHYHNISSYELGDNKLQYVGSPYQLTFGDRGQDRGFWFLKDNFELEFIKNEVSSTFKEVNYINIDNETDLSNSFVKIDYPNTISDEDLFKLTKKIEQLSPISYRTEPKIVEKISELSEEEEDENADKISEAINSGNMMQVSEIYMEVFKPNHLEIVKEFLEDFSKKIK